MGRWTAGRAISKKRRCQGRSATSALPATATRSSGPCATIQIGDPLQLTTRDRVYHFRITKTTIVGPKDVHVLNPTPEPTLTLVTCYPFEYIGRAPRRFIVQARLVNEEMRIASAQKPNAIVR